MFILAEAAQGYEGSVEKALLLTKAAHKAGAHGIKFQIIYADELCLPSYPHYGLFKSLEMPDRNWEQIVRYARDVGIEVYFDIFGHRSVNLAIHQGVKKIKIHSTSFFDDDLFREAEAFASQILVSIGGIYPDELERILKKRIEETDKQIVILYGYQDEPTPTDKNNLARLVTLANYYQIPVGFMDHSEGNGLERYTLSSLALGMGIRFFEKHITIERSLELEDYVSALGPTEFALYVKNLHSLHGAIGSSSLDLTDAERKYREKVLKAVVSSKLIKKGEIIVSDMLDLKRPDIASSDRIFEKQDIIGRKALRDIPAGQHISFHETQESG